MSGPALAAYVAFVVLCIAEGDIDSFLIVTLTLTALGQYRYIKHLHRNIAAFVKHAEVHLHGKGEPCNEQCRPLREGPLT